MASALNPIILGGSATQGTLIILNNRMLIFSYTHILCVKPGPLTVLTFTFKLKQSTQYALTYVFLNVHVDAKINTLESEGKFSPSSENSTKHASQFDLQLTRNKQKLNLRVYRLDF